MAIADILFAAAFNAAVLFLVAAGLQLVFGVLRIVNLTAGSLYALGAYCGAAAATTLTTGYGSPALLLPGLILVGAAAGLAGYPVERLLKLVHGRDESIQFLMTFAFVLVFQDLLRAVWGPQTLIAELPSAYGRVGVGPVSFPVYNLGVIACAILVAAGLWWMIERSRYGKIIMATAENREMAEAMGVRTSRVNTWVFMLGSSLSAAGGALVAPTTAASLDMPIALIVQSFAVVVIGGLGSMRGAYAGAIIVGGVRSISLAYLPEAETMAVYLVVVAVLAVRPYGLFGRSVR